MKALHPLSRTQRSSVTDVKLHPLIFPVMMIQLLHFWCRWKRIQSLYAHLLDAISILDGKILPGAYADCFLVVLERQKITESLTFRLKKEIIVMIFHLLRFWIFLICYIFHCCLLASLINSKFKIYICLHILFLIFQFWLYLIWFLPRKYLSSFSFHYTRLLINFPKYSVGCFLKLFGSFLIGIKQVIPCFPRWNI